MASSAAKRLLALALAGAALAPVIGQDAPKSLLPPGFEDAPAPAAAPAPAPATPTSAPGAAADAPTDADGVPPLAGVATPAPGIDPMSLPSQARSLDVTGWLPPEAGGYGAATFDGADGRYLVGMMRRIDTPIASRWAHIVLRRALLSQVPTPRGLRPADWVAERAWLLVRMGEADGAKALVESVPLDRYTPRLYAVAAQAHLATGDVPALCPLAPTARTVSREPLWPLMDAMCAGMEGDDITSSSIFDRLRDREAVTPFDIALAERLATAVNGGGRAANVEWQDVDRLTVYRFGLAAAGGVMPPPELLARANPQVRAWLFRIPSAPVERRLAMLPTAGMLGVASAAEMVKAHAAAWDSLDPSEAEASPAGRLRAAFVARRPADKLAAMRTLWSRGSDPGARYAAAVLTAPAAARLRPDSDLAEASPALVASMLAAGYERQAARWWPVADAAGGKTRAAVWAMLAAADSTGRIPIDGSAFDAWYAAETDSGGEGRAQRRGQLFAAALAGLGRGGDWLDRAEDLGSERLDNLWTRRIEAAAAQGRIGEVALLAAIGLQTNWNGVPPQHLAHIVNAYRRAGRTGEARMLAAEALARG